MDLTEDDEDDAEEEEDEETDDDEEEFEEDDSDLPLSDEEPDEMETECLRALYHS